MSTIRSRYRYHNRVSNGRPVCRLANGHLGKVDFEKLTFWLVLFKYYRDGEREKTTRSVILIAWLFKNINQSTFNVFNDIFLGRLRSNHVTALNNEDFSGSGRPNVPSEPDACHDGNRPVKKRKVPFNRYLIAARWTRALYRIDRFFSSLKQRPQ